MYLVHIESLLKLIKSGYNKLKDYKIIGNNQSKMIITIPLILFTPFIYINFINYTKIAYFIKEFKKYC